MDDKIFFHNFEIKADLVNEKLVNVMNDTECATVCVRADLSSIINGLIKERFFMINNSFDFAPIAAENIKCPWSQGKVEARYPSSLINDLIYGQIP